MQEDLEQVLILYIFQRYKRALARRMGSILQAGRVIALRAFRDGGSRVLPSSPCDCASAFARLRLNSNVCQASFATLTIPHPSALLTQVPPDGRRFKLPLGEVSSCASRRLVQYPLEGPNPPAQLVLRDHEDSQVRRAPLEELTAQLLKTLANRLVVPHVEPRVSRR